MNNILVIEDNNGDAEKIKTLLEDAAFRHRFYHSTSLTGGMNILHDQTIDLVLLDLSLNDSVGFGTLKSYMNEAADVPVIVLTGNKSEIMGMQSVRAGAQDFLIKGEFDGRRLVNTIKYSLQRFKTQAKLQETAEKMTISAQRYQETQKMANFANWEMDIVNNVMKWSEGMYMIFGFKPQSFSPSLSDYIGYVHVEDKEKVENFFDTAVKTGKLTKVEHRILIDNRIIRHLSVRAQVKYDEYANKIILLGNLQDITDSKESSKEEEGQEESNPISRINHEAITKLGFNIRTPLSSIVNLLYLLENTQPNGHQVELLDGLKTSIDDLSIVLNNLFNLSLLDSRASYTKDEDVKLPELLESLERIFSLRAEQSAIRIQFKTIGHLPEKVSCDAQKLIQVLYNLIEQAIQHRDGKNKVEFKSSRIVGHGHITLKFAISYIGRPFTFQYFDDEKRLHQLLEKITNGKNEGMLSLAIAAKLIHLLRGTLTIQQKGGNQQIINFEVPVRTPTDDEGENIPGPLRILLVEDHVLNQIATKQVLTSWSDLIEVDIASNGLEGIRQFKEKKYDLILMDIQMPEINGIDAAHQIRDFSNVPIIALSANTSKQEETRCKNAGMQDYLSKPIKPEELQSCIMRVLKNRR